MVVWGKWGVHGGENEKEFEKVAVGGMLTPASSCGPSPTWRPTRVSDDDSRDPAPAREAGRTEVSGTSISVMRS